MRKAAIAATIGVALIAGPVFAGGLGGSSAPSARIPIPAKEFAGTVEDQSGTRVDVTSVSYNGEVFLYGLVGEGQVTIPFDTIKSVRFEPSSESGKRIAFVQLRDGKSVSVSVDADVPAYGRTSYGTYSITVEKIRAIEFAASATP